MSMRRSGVAAIRHSYSRPWVEKAACSRSTGTRKPSRPGASALPTKCGLRSSMRRLPISRRCVQAHSHGRPCRGVLFDLGVSSPQLDDPSRGFSFRADGPIDMRMDTTRGEPVSAWLARAGVDEIREVIATLGEERFARRIAQSIVAARAEAPLERTSQLAALVARAVKTREPGKNPATRTFQALRMFINDELGQIEKALAGALQVLDRGGRLAVISFHSLEDRLVKRFMKRESEADPALVAPGGAAGAGAAAEARGQEGSRRGRRKWTAIPARAARCCGWRRKSDESAVWRMNILSGKVLVDRRRALGRGAGLGCGRDLLQAPRARDVHPARAVECTPRQHRHPVGPAAARAERLVHPRACRERREQEAAYGDAASERHRDRSAMRTRNALDAAPRSFRWRAYVLVGLLGSPRVAFSAARSICSSSITPSWRSRAMRASRASSRLPRIAARSPTATASRSPSARRSTPSGSTRSRSRSRDQIPRLAQALGLNAQDLLRRVTTNLDRDFLYLARHCQPAEAERIKALGIPAFISLANTAAITPRGKSPVTSSASPTSTMRARQGSSWPMTTGSTGIDGAKRVIQDRYGRIVQNVESIRPARPGATSCCRSICASSISPIAS